MWFALLLMMALGVSSLLNFIQFAAAVGGGGSAMAVDRDNLQEVVLKSNESPHKIAVIEIGGLITSYSYDGTGKSMVDYIKAMLERAAKDAAVKAVLLKVDSPGGEVLASDDIYGLIKAFQEDHSKPVVAAMLGTAASGGYYVSAPCRWIVANDLTMTGSIGVIMHGYNFRGLMDRVGVQPLTFKSGAMKDMLSSTKRMEDVSKEERAIVQAFIDETFGRFKQVVGEGRAFAAAANGDDGRALADDWEKYADGRLLSGKQAHELGFIDELGNFDVAVARTLKIAGVPEANLVSYRQIFKLGSIFRLLGESEQKTVKLDLGLNFPKLRAGQAYFLPSGLGY